MTATFPTPTWLAGCGNMAGAMVEGWRAGGVDLAGITAIRPSGVQVEGIRTVTAYPSDEKPKLVMLGFKPQKLGAVAAVLEPHVDERAILVSMLAGVNSASLQELFPRARSIIRIMPNLPVAQIQGVIALYAEHAAQGDRDLVGKLASWLGMIRWCEDEATFAIIGAIASSGPAYIARFVDALAKAGEGLGLSPRLAASIALQTVVGTGAMAAATSPSMQEIARRVASPGGTTEAGLAVLDCHSALDQLVEQTIAAAIDRGSKLAAVSVVQRPPLA
ncbi:MAG: pyrroline-5-carboxylate reductase dimerization domain-containing protein [Kofleriaceae bacterium]